MSQSGKFGLKKFVKTSGTLGVFDIINDTQIQIIVENAGPVNTVAVYGKIQGQNNYVLIDTLVGTGTKTIAVGVYDFLDLEVVAYDSLGTYIDIAGSGFNLSSGGGGTFPSSIAVNNFPATQNVNVLNPVTNVNAIVRASDGTPITHTTVGPKEALDVNIVNTINGNTFAPTDFDDVQTERDVEDDPIFYYFYKSNVLIRTIAVTYNSNKSSIRYRQI